MVLLSLGDAILLSDLTFAAAESINGKFTPHRLAEQGDLFYAKKTGH